MQGKMTTTLAISAAAPAARTTRDGSGSFSKTIATPAATAGTISAGTVTAAGHTIATGDVVSVFWTDAVTNLPMRRYNITAGTVAGNAIPIGSGGGSGDTLPTSGAVTISKATLVSTVAINQVESLKVVDNTGSGTFTLTIEGITTGAITYSATPATLVSNINTALNAAFGSSAIVASGATLAGIILTFSGTGYSGRPINGHAASTITQTGSTFTINGSATSGTTTANTLGVVSSSLFAGSQLQQLLVSSDQRGVCQLFSDAGTTSILVVNATDKNEGVNWCSGGPIAVPFSAAISQINAYNAVTQACTWTFTALLT